MSPIQGYGLYNVLLSSLAKFSGNRATYLILLPEAVNRKSLSILIIKNFNPWNRIYLSLIHQSLADTSQISLCLICNMHFTLWGSKYNSTFGESAWIKLQASYR